MMKLNDKTLKLLRQHVMIDPEISEVQRQKDLATIADVKEGLDSGRYVAIDRTEMIKQAAQKKQGSAFRKKLKAKSRKARRNATEANRSVKSVDAFDESFMYASESEVRKFAESSGITDAYAETVRFDEEWN